MTTLKDLSRRLDLSVTQVSRALNDHWDVKQETKERVRRLAEELNYRPNLTARKLVTGKASTVGFVQQGMPPAEESWLYMQIIGELSKEFSRRGLQFLFNLTDEKDVLKTYDSLIRAQTIDSFVLFNPTAKDARIEFLMEKKIPFVCHGRALDRSDYSYFDVDNRAIGYELTRHLLQHGHRKIGMINGQEGLSFNIRRQAGYQQALNEFEIALNAEYLVNGQMTERLGFEQATRMLSVETGRPTAFIATNTRILLGILRACDELGMRVPKDVSVVAHDDHLDEIQVENFACPVTTTDSPIGDSLKHLAQLLTDATSGAPLAKTQELRKAKLLERASVSVLK